MAAPRHRLSDPSGQTAAEYLGLLLVVAVILWTLASSAPGRAIAQAADQAICRIAGGECSTGESAAPIAAAGREAGTPVAGPDPERVREAVEELRDALDGGTFGTRAGDLEDFQRTLEGLSSADLDAAIAELSDAELERLFDQMDDGLVFSGWSRDRRREFLETIADRVSPETIARLARFTDELQPAFDDVGGDDAANSPDSPVNGAGYGTVPHQLFIAGEEDGGQAVHPNDVDQGAIGDCWIMTGLIATAQERPDIIEDMIRANPNGTYTVTFMDGDDPVEVTVTPDIPLGEDGRPIFAEHPAAGTDTAGRDYELWPMIVEKAYARYSGDYDEIEGGYAEDALEAITGAPSERHDMDALSLDELAGIRERGGAVVLSSLGDDDATERYESGELVPNHAYYVTDVDRAAGTVTIRNPWGYHYDPITLSYAEFQENFDRVGTNALSG